MEDRFVSKRDMIVGGVKVSRGQIISPTGAMHDSSIYGDNTHWTSRWNPMIGQEPLPCDTDGCPAQFASLGLRDRHRRIVHAPEREDVLRFQRERNESRIASEVRGETIGGYEVVKTKPGSGTREDTPYIKLTG